MARPQSDTPLVDTSIDYFWFAHLWTSVSVFNTASFDCGSMFIDAS